METDLGPYRTAPPEPPKPKGRFAKLHLALMALWGLAVAFDLPLLIWEPTALRWVNAVAHVLCLAAWSYVAWTYKKIDEAKLIAEGVVRTPNDSNKTTPRTGRKVEKVRRV